MSWAQWLASRVYPEPELRVLIWGRSVSANPVLVVMIPGRRLSIVGDLPRLPEMFLALPARSLPCNISMGELPHGYPRRVSSVLCRWPTGHGERRNEVSRPGAREVWGSHPLVGLWVNLRAFAAAWLVLGRRLCLSAFGFARCRCDCASVRRWASWVVLFGLSS